MITERIRPHLKDLGGGFVVRRLLPSVDRQSVGPFLFFDHFGPIEVQPGENHDVRPHPHIGLATVTYLFDGAMLHRDSLGVVQRIEPGAINWMTAGRGIVHSERAPDDLRAVPHRMHGLQLWAALPFDHEEAEPAFVHTAAAELPVFTALGVRVRVLIGEACGLVSPVRTFAPTLYLDVALEPGASFVVPHAEELAVYAVDQGVIIGGEELPPFTLATIQPGPVTAPDGARFVVIGGAALGARRTMWWNLVSTRPERIREAAAAWAEGRFPGVPGDPEFIPLPALRLP